MREDIESLINNQVTLQLSSGEFAHGKLSKPNSFYKFEIGSSFCLLFPFEEIKGVDTSTCLNIIYLKH